MPIKLADIPVEWRRKLTIDSDPDGTVRRAARSERHPYNDGSVFLVRREVTFVPGQITLNEERTAQLDEGELRSRALDVLRNLQADLATCASCGAEMSADVRVVSFQIGIEHVLLCASCIREAVHALGRE